MSGDVQVTHGTVVTAAQEWDQVADGLDGAWRRLHGAAVSDLDPEVSSATEAFRETWVDEVKRCAQDAQRHSEALEDAAAAYLIIDEATLERMRTLLPWEYRDAELLQPPTILAPGAVPGSAPGPVTD